MHTSMSKVYAVRKCSTSAVTTAFTRTSTKKISKRYWQKAKKRLVYKSLAYKWIYIIINKIYKRVTKPSTHEVPK